MIDAFAKALIDPAPRVPSDIINSGNRFNVYRNNYLVGLIDTLAGTFPVVNELVGREYFNAVAHTFVTEYPPASPTLSSYGDGFAVFLEHMAKPNSPRYLPDVARVEWARAAAPHVQHQPAFMVSSQEDLEASLEMPVRLAAGASLIRSPYPVGTIWQRHQSETVVPISDWVPETVAVWWGSGRLQQAIIRPDAEAMVSSLSGGEPLLGLLGNATDENQATHFISTFATFLNQGLFVPDTPEQGETRK